jgi:putative ATP-dependent endonuclease of OLD family
VRLASIRVENFRCLRDLELELDSVTVLVGANGSGKSSVLHALKWFFAGGDIELRDVTGHEEGLTTAVTARFHDFDAADRAALGRYAEGESATFERRWSAEEGEKLTGRSRAYPAFEEIRSSGGAMAKREAYAQLRAARSDLDLPVASSAQAVLDAMENWEAANPEKLETASVSATHLFGAVGSARLAGRFDYVLIPAVAQVEREARDDRGTLLRQLLDRFIVVRPELRERLARLAAETQAQANEIIGKEGREDLSALARVLTEELRRLVPDTTIALEPLPVDLSVPSTSVGLTISDSGLETDVARQGHGVQRSLFMAMVQQLAVPRPRGAADAEAAPRILLAIEEPELFQHPLQARHLARTLARLAEGEAGVQVLYATHSEHFVDPTHFTHIRRFQRQGGSAPAVSAITQATIDRVADRLGGAVPRDQIAARVRITLGRGLAEATFARGAVIVEGRTDAAFLLGLSERDMGLDALGIALVLAGGKSQLLLPWAVLEELGVPSYMIFDGDGNLGDRLTAQGRTAEEAAPKIQQARVLNENLLRALGEDPTPDPATIVGTRFACFHADLETECARWDGFEDKLREATDELGDFRGKSEDAYRVAAQQAPDPVPPLFVQLLDAVKALTRV